MSPMSRSRLGLSGSMLLVALLLASLGAFVDAQVKDPKKDPKVDPKDAKKEVKQPPIAMRVECSRDDAKYKEDEPAVFLFVTNTSGDLEYTFTEDGLKPVGQGKLQVKAGQTYRLEGKLGHPGFLKVQLKQTIGMVSGSAWTIAAVAPEKITPTAKPPADFEEFWKTQLEELAKVRIDPVVEFWPLESTPLIDVYRVDLGSIDERHVYGWLSMPWMPKLPKPVVPKGSKEAPKPAPEADPVPRPAILTMPYAGVYAPTPDLYHAGLGAVALTITIHDHPVSHPADFYKKEAEGPLKDYTRIGWDDRDKSYYRYAILAGVRAIDYLKSRKDVLEKEICVTGISQGGGLALCVSGLDPRVSYVAPDVAGLCDLNARSQGRIDGWPHWVASAPDNLKEKVEATSQYFDAVNFARKFKGKSLHGVGFLDTVCPPSTVYAAFNQHPDPKVMIASPQFGHNTDPAWTKAREEFWKANLSLKPPTPKVKELPKKK